jgi:hypothetical protein
MSAVTDLYLQRSNIKANEMCKLVKNACGKYKLEYTSFVRARNFTQISTFCQSQQTSLHDLMCVLCMGR